MKKVPFRINAATFLHLTQILMRLLYNVFRIAIGPAITPCNISTNEKGGFKSTTIGVTSSTSSINYFNHNVYKYSILSYTKILVKE